MRINHNKATAMRAATLACQRQGCLRSKHDVGHTNGPRCRCNERNDRQLDYASTMLAMAPSRQGDTNASTMPAMMPVRCLQGC
jgi:hypothetical protein